VILFVLAVSAFLNSPRLDVRDVNLVERSGNNLVALPELSVAVVKVLVDPFLVGEDIGYH